jgi:hypothetical protein
MPDNLYLVLVDLHKLKQCLPRSNLLAVNSSRSEPNCANDSSSLYDAKSRRNVPANKPLPVEHQVLIIYALTKGYLDDIPVVDITRFEDQQYVYHVLIYLQ